MDSQSSASPRYAQLRDHILQQIRSGAWRPGARVPSAPQLSRKFKVAPMTAHKALQELNRAGVVRRIVGVGSFVADFKAAGHPLEIRNIAAEIRGRGHVHRAAVIKAERVKPTPDVRERLALRASERFVFHTLIVHFEGELPLQVEDRYVSPSQAPGYLDVDFASVTPNEYLMEVAPLQRVEHTVHAAVPLARVAKLLNLDVGEPVLVIERVTWSRGTQASFARLYHPGSRFELRGGFEM